MTRWSDLAALDSPCLAACSTPLLLGVVVFYFLREPLAYWRQGEALYDEQAIKEWVREARVGTSSLPELLKDFLERMSRGQHRQAAIAPRRARPASIRSEHEQKREEIKEMLQALCVPPTKIYAGQLPLFPMIYRLEVRFDDDLKKKYRPRAQFRADRLGLGKPAPSEPVPRARRLPASPRRRGAKVYVQYQLHAYMQKQFKEREDDAKRRLINIWVLFFAFVALLWMLLDAAPPDRPRTPAQADRAANPGIEAKTPRGRAAPPGSRTQAGGRRAQAARGGTAPPGGRTRKAGGGTASARTEIADVPHHRHHGEVVRPQHQELARAPQRSAAPLPRGASAGRRRKRACCTKSSKRSAPSPSGCRRFCRPCSAIRTSSSACRSTSTLSPRNCTRPGPSRPRANGRWWSNSICIPPGSVYRDRGQRQTEPTPLYVSGDRSHLQQTLENFLFNARDAIAEMRNHLRKQARPEGAALRAPLDETQRQALIAAAGWKGRVVIRTAHHRRPTGHRSPGQRHRHDAGNARPLHGAALLDQAQQRPLRGPERRHGPGLVVCTDDPASITGRRSRSNRRR